MRLSQALHAVWSASDLYDIFAGNPVAVEINGISDSVTVEGYEGSITTDQIAISILRIRQVGNRELAKNVAVILRDKVFFPLKREIEAPENRCALYQLVALQRIFYTPPPATPGLGSYVSLKHAMCLDWLTGEL